jgi:hypothetical protein
MAFTGQGDFLSNDIASTEGTAVLDIFLVVGFALAILLVDRGAASACSCWGSRG